MNTNNQLARQRGTTLIELSIVIAVLLLLAGVLFIGVQAWQNAANNAACIVNQATIQKAVRGYANFNGLNVGQALTVADLTVAAAPQAPMFNGVLPACPIANTAYAVTGTVPAQGVEYATCVTVATGNNGAPHVPAAATIVNW